MNAKTLKREYRSRRLTAVRKRKQQPTASPRQPPKSNPKRPTLATLVEQTKKVTQRWIRELRSKPKDMTGSERKELRRLFREQRYLEGWKLTNGDGTPAFGKKVGKRKIPYEVGTTMRLGNRQPIRLCKNGLHFCIHPSATLRYAKLYRYARLFRVVAHGRLVHSRHKSIASCLTPVQEYRGKEKIQLLHSRI